MAIIRKSSLAAGLDLGDQLGIFPIPKPGSAGIVGGCELFAVRCERQFQDLFHAHFELRQQLAGGYIVDIDLLVVTQQAI